MRVAIMAYLLHRGTGYRAAGVSAYIAGIVEHLPLASPQHQYIALHGRDAWVPAGVQSVPSPLPTMRPAVRILWEQTGAIRDARVARADLFHGPVNVVPLLSGLPRVVTIHDLAFLRHPERFRRGRVLYLRAMVAASVRGSRHTIAVSEITRQDLIALLGTPAQGITVVPPGVGSQFAPIPPDGIDTFRRSLFEGRPFILHVGTLEPRKN
ncbi:MAG: glycosyltransferase, partial [Chloroflexota bacterium]